jgi:hypothetical protein
MRFKKFEEFQEKDLEPIKSFYLKDELNPKLWDNFELDEEVREKLLQIAQDFYNSTELEAEIKDIILTGSLANYNWSEKYSDYDLHILIDFDDVDDNVELVKKFVDGAKKNWNDEHDIKIKGYEVEVYIQDIDEPHKSSGVFSLFKNKWKVRPEKVEFIPDENAISEKAKSIMMSVDDIEEQVDEDKYTSFKEKIDKVWKKIKKQRQSGLEEGGEFGLGNLVFKLLRRNGYISKIMELKRYAYDKQFERVYEWYDDTLLNFFYELDKISKKLNEESDESWGKWLDYEYNEENNTIHIGFGTSGYSEGFHEDWNIDFNDLEEILVKRSESHSGPYGDGENEYDMRFSSFEELLQEIKENF